MSALLRSLLLVTALALVGASPAAAADSAGPATGDGVQPTLVAGNPNCAQLYPGTSSFKDDSPGDDTYDLTFTSPPFPVAGTAKLAVDVRNTAQGQVFDFAVLEGTLAVKGVIVKGGPNADSYDYGVNGSLDDTSLHPPVNDANGQYYGLSHYEFCFAVPPPPPPAKVKVKKVTKLGGAVIEDPTDFGFDIVGGGANASPTLDTDPVSGTPQESAESQVTNFTGTVSVTEDAPPAGWTLDSVSCTGTDAANVASKAGGVDVDVKPGETVLCTFTNVATPPKVTVKKVTTSGGAPVESVGPFTVDVDGSGIDQTPSLDTAPGTPADDTAGPFVATSLGKAYVTETALPAGWTLAGIACNGSVKYGTGTGPAFVEGIDPGWDAGDTVAEVTLAAGDDVLCTFTNDAALGKVVVKKVNVGGPAGDSFTFTPSADLGGGTFPLKGGESLEVVNLVATQFGKSYAVAETVPAGYTLTSATCDDGSPVSAIDVAPGETVTCTFTNTKDADPPPPVQQDPPQQQQQQPAPVQQQAPSQAAPPPVVEPARQVAAQRVRTPGSARLQAPAGCREAVFSVRVTGRQIRRVTFTLNGRALASRRVSGNTTSATYQVRIDPRKLPRRGINRVNARVVFTAQSRTRARTFRLTFQRCLQAAPRFTG